MKYLIFFLILVTSSIFSIEFATSQIISDSKKLVDETIPDSGSKQVHTIDEIKIEDGSIISSTEVTLVLNADPTKECILKLIDNILDEIEISEKFICFGTQVILFNTLGNHAVTNNIQKDSLNFSVEFVDESKVKPDFVIIRYKIDYKIPTYFVKIENNTVTNIIVADQNFIDTLSGTWIETKSDGSIRGFYAGIGDLYNSTLDVFVEQDEPASDTSGIIHEVIEVAK